MMHVVCLNMEQHFLKLDSKPMCIHMRCLQCQKVIYLCELCRETGLRECEECASEQILAMLTPCLSA